MFVFGIFVRKPRIISPEHLIAGDVRRGDLLLFSGACPRAVGDECVLVGNYPSVICAYKGELYYKVVDERAHQ